MSLNICAYYLFPNTSAKNESFLRAPLEQRSALYICIMQKENKTVHNSVKEKTLLRS